MMEKEEEKKTLLMKVFFVSTQFIFQGSFQQKAERERGERKKERKRKRGSGKKVKKKKQRTDGVCYLIEIGEVDLAEAERDSASSQHLGVVSPIRPK